MSSRLLVTLTVMVTVVVGGCSGTDTEPYAGPQRSAPTETLTSPQPALSYVALGDSFTAAPGIPDTDTSDGCLRSSHNYPSLVTEQLEVRYDVALADRSCSGADTTDLAGEQTLDRDPLPPQFDALQRDTDLVTLSVGGNDYGAFVRLIGGCAALAQEEPGGSPCRDAAESQRDVLASTQLQIEQRLVDAITEIQRRSPQAQVLVVGYPQLVPADGACPDLLPLASGDLPFARRINRDLTDNLARAAGRTDTTYVDVWAASEDHDICAERPWVNGLESQQGGAIPFHPLPAGQAAIAQLVLDRVRAGTGRD